MREHTSIRKIKTRDSGLYGSELKLIAVITMIIDHTGGSILRYMPAVGDETSLTYIIYWILRLIGRCAFPIYCFFLVEGFMHTRNKAKYAFRLFLFCLISEIPFDLGLFRATFDWTHQNVFFTLLLGLITMTILEYINANTSKLCSQAAPLKTCIKYICLAATSAYFSYKAVYFLHKYMTIKLNDWILYAIMAAIGVYVLMSLLSSISLKISEEKAFALCLSLSVVALAMLLADLGHTDYSSAGILTIVIMYVYRKDYYRRITAGCVVLTALTNPAELASFVAMPLILKYNGKKGSSIKYLYYVAYPIHLMILYLIRDYVLGFKGGVL